MTLSRVLLSSDQPQKLLLGFQARLLSTNRGLQRLTDCRIHVRSSINGWRRLRSRIVSFCRILFISADVGRGLARLERLAAPRSISSRCAYSTRMGRRRQASRHIKWHILRGMTLSGVLQRVLVSLKTHPFCSLIVKISKYFLGIGKLAWIE